MPDSRVGHGGNYALRDFHCRTLAYHLETDAKGRYEDGGQAASPGREMPAA